MPGRNVIRLSWGWVQEGCSEVQAGCTAKHQQGNVMVLQWVQGKDATELQWGAKGR